MQERVSRRRQSNGAIKRAALSGNERRSSVPIRVDLSGQPPSTYTDRASAQWTRTAQILSVAPVSSHQDDSRTRSGGLRNVQSGSVWAARDRQRAVCVLFLAARPRFYEIIRGPEVLRDHPRSSEVVYELHLAKKSFPLSSTTMKAGKSTTSIFHTASIPSSGYSSTSCFLIASLARIAAGPPIEPK